MTTKEQFQTLFAYTGAMFNRTLDCAELLSQEEYKQRVAYKGGSLHDTLFHIVFWLNLWRIGLEGDNTSPGLPAEEFPNIAALRAGMQVEMTEWQRLIANLSEADFIAERDAIGSTFPLWRILQHLVLHAMQHHAEAAAILTAKGYSPGGIDFIWYTG